MQLTSTETPIAKRPYLILLWIELALIIFVAGGSAYVSIAELTHPAAPFLGFIPLALFLLFFLIRKNRARTYYLTGISAIKGRQWLDYAPLLLILIVLLISNNGFAAAPASTFVYLLLTQLLLVGFVEETLFRGILMRVFAHKGIMYAVIISSVFFGITHALQALGGQSLEDTLLQIVYAFGIGFMLALLVAKHRAVLLTILFHGLHNFINMTGNEPSTHLYDYIVLAIIAVYCLWLLRSVRKTRPANQRVAPSVT
ncbi:CPBP family intramembrane glutamic endopeptidase [Paenibacillus sp. NPDC057967]|uniref:CPBP family intramembrane glutamic endopeptidase n=1 Tax=Paenibacillus sp. NPDC057967 TaxID=3346293 RepID=UPI0036D810DE